MQRETIKAVVLVKASPVLTAKLDESMCVAGATVDGEPSWVRFHPVPFRDLDSSSKFKKYQVVEIEVARAVGDRRPESWKPTGTKIRLLNELSTADGWAARRNVVDSLPRPTMCKLHEQNKSGSGPGVTSLAVIETDGPPAFVIEKRDQKQIGSWQKRADAIDAQPSLFDQENTIKAKFEVCPWRFKYNYRCLEPKCTGHSQTIVDWEAVALWRNIRRQPDWQAKMRQKFEVQMWANDRDTILFVGNMNQHPQSFLVLGIFWPPKGPVQQSLL